MGMCDVTVIALKCNLLCKRGVMHIGTVQIHGSQPVISAPCILKLIVWLEC